jgi:hypothetical protein
VTITWPVISAVPNVEAVLRDRALGNGLWGGVGEGITGVNGTEAGTGDFGEVLAHPQNRITMKNTPAIAIAWTTVFILYFSIVPVIKDMSDQGGIKKNRQHDLNIIKKKYAATEKAGNLLPKYPVSKRFGARIAAIIQLSRPMYIFKEPSTCWSSYGYTCRQFIQGESTFFFTCCPDVPKTGMQDTGTISRGYPLVLIKGS